jgi:putative lipoprotein
MARIPLLRTALALLALLVMGSFARAEDLVFRGTVAYAEAAHLPAASELWVNLVALPSGAPVASAASPISLPAKSPLDFVLRVRTRVLSASAEYGLVAEIRSAGQTLFKSAAPTEVQTPPTAPLALRIVHAPSLAPRSATTEAPPSLLDTAWRITSIAGKPVAPEGAVTLSIAFDHRAGGNSGCNNYFTEASFDGDSLAFGPVAGTRTTCPAEVMEQEAALFAALAATRSHDADGDTLRLLDAAGIPLVGLVRQP